MSSPFLIGFADALLARLLHDQLIEIVPGTKNQIAAFVAAGLGRSSGPTSLISHTADLLLKCPDVEELYADDESLKELIVDLKAGVRR